MTENSQANSDPTLLKAASERAKATMLCLIRASYGLLGRQMSRCKQLVGCRSPGGAHLGEYLRFLEQIDKKAANGVEFDTARKKRGILKTAYFFAVRR